jgi:hypothetical protein
MYDNVTASVTNTGDVVISMHDTLESDANKLLTCRIPRPPKSLWWRPSLLTDKSDANRSTIRLYIMPALTWPLYVQLGCPPRNISAHKSTDFLSFDMHTVPDLCDSSSSSSSSSVTSMISQPMYTPSPPASSMPPPPPKSSADDRIRQSQQQHENLLKQAESAQPKPPQEPKPKQLLCAQCHQEIKCEPGQEPDTVVCCFEPCSRVYHPDCAKDVRFAGFLVAHLTARPFVYVRHVAFVYFSLNPIMHFYPTQLDWKGKQDGEGWHCPKCSICFLCSKPVEDDEFWWCFHCDTIYHAKQSNQNVSPSCEPKAECPKCGKNRYCSHSWRFLILSTLAFTHCVFCSQFACLAKLEFPMSLHILSHPSQESRKAFACDLCSAF